MKWIFGAIKLVLIFGFMALAFLLLINKTFINEIYTSEEKTGTFQKELIKRSI